MREGVEDADAGRTEAGFGKGRTSFIQRDGARSILPGLSKNRRHRLRFATRVSLFVTTWASQ